MSAHATALGEREQFMRHHKGVGFMLAGNIIDVKSPELMIDWCAGVLVSGLLGTVESLIAEVSVSESLMRSADRCMQVTGGTGVSRDTVVEQVFPEVRAFHVRTVRPKSIIVGWPRRSSATGASARRDWRGSFGCSEGRGAIASLAACLACDQLGRQSAETFWCRRPPPGVN